MNDEITPEEIAELEAKGWEFDKQPTAAGKRYEFPSFSESLSFLMELGEEAERIGAMPAIRIDGGDEVYVRLGREPAPALTAAEIALARVLADL